LATAVWETERLYLRDLGPAQAAAVRAYGLRSAEYHKPWDPARPADYWELPAVAARLKSQQEESRSGSALCLCLSRKDDPEHIIGVANLRNVIRGALLSAHLGYALAPDAVGQGYMTEAVDRVVRIAFAELALHRVECNIMPRNARSLAVAQRAGFEREGFSPRYLRINGHWEDHVRLARLNEATS
jgi:[ribosomal protein S5]-alanine N-acetyltransferase